jgi:hypothetical protein
MSPTSESAAALMTCRDAGGFPLALDSRFVGDLEEALTPRAFRFFRGAGGSKIADILVFKYILLTLNRASSIRRTACW